MTNSLVRLGSVLSLVAVLPAADVAAFLDRGRASWPENLYAERILNSGRQHIFHSVGVVTAVSTATGALDTGSRGYQGLNACDGDDVSCRTTRTHRRSGRRRQDCI